MTLKEKILDYLERRGEPVPEQDIYAAAARQGYLRREVRDMLHKMERIAYVGRIWNRDERRVEWRVYTQKEHDALTQKFLDNGTF